MWTRRSRSTETTSVRGFDARAEQRPVALRLRRFLRQLAHRVERGVDMSPIDPGVVAREQPVELGEPRQRTFHAVDLARQLGMVLSDRLDRELQRLERGVGEIADGEQAARESLETGRLGAGAGRLPRHLVASIAEIEQG